MNKTQSETAKKSTATHRRTQASSTLNRKYVKSPSTRKANNSRNVVKASASEAGARAERAIQKAAEQKRRQEKAAAMQRQATAKLQQKSGKKPATRVAKATSGLSAKERKDQAIQQALKSVAVVEQDNTIISSKSLQKPAKASTKPAKAAKKSAKKTRKVRSKHTHVERSTGGGKRFFIAFTCAAACVAALAFFINANMPDISVRVAAMQTGIEASYPSYVPRDYSLANINSEEGKITMDFSGPGGDSFTLVEEKSSWDSSALLNNYVKPTWEDAYTVTHEQGITIYISGSDAAWVNGGILYTLDASSNNLTKKQIRTIVTSL